MLIHEFMLYNYNHDEISFYNHVEINSLAAIIAAWPTEKYTEASVY